MRGRTTIFTKEPRAGAVKTRLCPPLTPEAAAELAEVMLGDTLTKLRDAEETLELALHPPEAVERARRRFEGVRCSAQLGADLGARLASHFERAFETLGAREGRALRDVGGEVVIGSDAPQIPRGAIDAAHARLRGGAELVLGPDDGGGYWLVGLARSVPELFTCVPMSTGDMLERTLELARELGLATELVERHRDIDLPADVEWLARALSEDVRRAARGDAPRFDACPRTRRWLATRFDAGPEGGA